MSRRIEDMGKRDPFLHMLGAMGGSSNYIEQMEAEGQRQLVASTQLPIEGSENPRILEMGLTFGEPTDDLFRDATLPDGWKRSGSDHAMWSYIEDERGLKRIAVFYKAAFYDRKAFMHPECPGNVAANALIYGETQEDNTPWALFFENEKEAFIQRIHDHLSDLRYCSDESLARVPFVQARYDWYVADYNAAKPTAMRHPLSGPGRQAVEAQDDSLMIVNQDPGDQQ